MLPILVLFAICVGAWRLSRYSGERIDDLEEQDRTAGFDPHEPISVAEHRVENRLIAEATKRNREGR